MILLMHMTDLSENMLALVCGMMKLAAEQAVLPRFRTLTASEIYEKSPGNLVTDADIEAEQILSGLLTSFLPGSVVVGEESVSRDPDIMTRLNGPDPVWIIDPVDGTRNFTEGNDRFGMIVALMLDGQVRAGWLYFPTDQQFLLGSAQTSVITYDNAGWGMLPPTTAPVSEERFFENHILFSPYGHRGAEKRRLKTAIAPFDRITGYGCAAQEYRLLLNQAADIGFYSSIWPWDHAAGSFLLRLQGGAVINNQGYDYHPGMHKPDWIIPGRDPHAVTLLHSIIQKALLSPDVP